MNIDYKKYIVENFPEVFEDQYRIFKNGDEEILFYKNDNSFIYWNNLEMIDITQYVEQIFYF